MEYRKLISFGKSSYVISIPKNWIKQHKLKKGDVISVGESGPNLVLGIKQDEENSNKEKEMVIQIDGKTKDWLGREVCAAYILNYRKIIFKGKEVKSKIKILQEIIQNLIALEVMEQREDSIIAKDFLNMDTVSVEELIRKMDVVTRTMINEMKNIFKEDNYNNMNERDKDVNRLYFLLYRTIIYNLENPMKAIKNLNFGSLDLLKMKSVGFYVEAIADEARRTARYARLIKISDKRKKEFEELFDKINNYYVETMKTIYNKDIEKALRLSERKSELEKDLQKFEDDVQKVKHLYKVLCRLQRMLGLIHNLGRVIYTFN